MAGNKDIRKFFAKKEISSQTATPPPTTTPRQAQLPADPSIVYDSITVHTKSQASPIPSPVTSNLSPPPSSDASQALPTSGVRSEPPPPSNTSKSGRIVKSSDDEDSDSSLEDLNTIFGIKPAAPRPAPSTPATSRVKDISYNINVSPLAILPKYKANLKSLLKQAEEDKAMEESSKKIKSMEASREEQDKYIFGEDNDIDPSKLVTGAILESVIEGEDVGMEKVARAMKRTEAVNVEKRWYFFDTHNAPSQESRKPFPKASVPQEWRGELLDAATRKQTFVSGFAEDMVAFGQALPDEVYLWILDEACFEQDDVLRTSYFNTIRESPEKTYRLLTPAVVQKLFQNLGGTSNATSIGEEIIPKSGLPSQKTDHDWAPLRSLVQCLGRVTNALEQKTRVYVICLLLRMAADEVVFRNIDLLDLFQETVRRSCKYIEGESWESCCQLICDSLFSAVESLAIRLQIVEAISSISSRTHELRRRLALCFFYDDLSQSKGNPNTTINLDQIITRLFSKTFKITSKTDYHSLSSLISLLDIAVDDGRSTQLDFTNETTVQQFNAHVDELVQTVHDIETAIGNPGAAYISRIEAKEVLGLVHQRFADTLRTRPKARLNIFDTKVSKVEDLRKEKKGMSAFLQRSQAAKNSSLMESVAM